MVLKILEQQSYNFFPRQSATVLGPSGHLQKTPRQCATVPVFKTGGAPAGHYQSTMVPRPPGHLQKNPILCQTVSLTFGAPAKTLRQSATMPRPSWYLETVSQTVGAPAGDSHTVPEIYQTVGAQAGDSKTFCDGAKTVRTPAGDSSTVFDGVRDCRILLQTVREFMFEVAQKVFARRRWKSLACAPPVCETVWHHRRQSGNLLYEFLRS
ncbi:hypothetical protein DPMN_066977 [Dreissena polymorpha]|uniref:Uncharacterized protein n=1 Tax=Dreissena polymorpha TaxID=45954 RepID=A0A9D4BTA0_DREPO|nr:hypothetical protein DPMN_066977 [Dreissena polymorpha]